MRSILLLVLALPLFTFAQLTDVGVSIPDQGYNFSTTAYAYKNASNPKSCGFDTLKYGYYKGFGATYTALSVYDGYSVGQYYDAPEEVEISGMSFYSWGLFGTNDSVLVTVNLYEAGTDSLPYGSPIRSAQIYIDTVGGTLYFDRIVRHISFTSSYTSDHPFILTIESSDSNAIGVVANSWTAGKGERENIACATVGGTWYNCLNLNVGGTTLDADFLLEPHVQYDIYADFTFDDCYDLDDTVQFTNASSPLINHRMYNRLFYNDLLEFSFDWRTGDFNYYFNNENPKHKYNSPGNYNVELHTQLYRYANFDLCPDTAIKTIFYKPSIPSIKADTPVCSGDIITLVGSSSGDVSWHSSFASNDTLAQGNEFTTDTLTNNYLVFAQGSNEHCFSTRKAFLTRVIRVPDNPSVFNDSVCLNAKANLRATTNIGEVHWWSDTASSPQFLGSGNVYQTDILNTSKVYYAQANNQGCLSSDLVPVYANVSASNAPNPPDLSNDTLVCLFEGDITIEAYSSLPNIYWFNQASGGTAIDSGSNYNFLVNTPGQHIIYAEADDGQCGSTRVGTTITVDRFPALTIDRKDTLCLGDTAFFDYSGFDGSVRWYDDPLEGNLVYDSTVIALSGLTKTTQFFLEPYHGVCRDTVRHNVIVDILPFGTISNINASDVCTGGSSTITLSRDYGRVIWSHSPLFDSIFFEGDVYRSPPLQQNTTYYVATRNYICQSEAEPIDVKVHPIPYAGFNYQVSTPGNITFNASSSNLNYFWQLGDGNTSNQRSFTHQYTHNNKFVVSLETTSDEGCKDTLTRSITVTGLVTAVDELKSLNINVYPNPSSGLLHISADRPIHIKLYHSTGKIIADHGMIKHKSISMSDLSNGIYIVEVSVDGKTLRKRIILQQ